MVRNANSIQEKARLTRVNVEFRRFCESRNIGRLCLLDRNESESTQSAFMWGVWSRTARPIVWARIESQSGIRSIGGATDSSMVQRNVPV